MPTTATTQQLQKQYRPLFDQIKTKKQPLVILNKNRPEVVIIDLETFELLLETKQKYEEQQAQKAIKAFQKEKKSRNLKKLTTLEELMK